MSESSKTDLDMVHGPLYKKMLMFSLPLAFSQCLQMMFNAADVMVIGRFAGAEALAAVGAPGPLISILTWWFVGLSVGVNVVAARDYAAKKESTVSKDIHSAAAAYTLLGIFAAFVLLLAVRSILKLMSTPEEIIGRASVYLRIYAVGFPAAALYNVGAASLRSVGETKKPMYYLIVSGIINVLLNLFFVLVLHMGVAGVAVATVISQYVSCCLVVRDLMKRTDALKFRISALRIDKGRLFEIMKIGIPCMIEYGMYGFANMFVQAAINSLGTLTIAASAVCDNVENLLLIFPNVISQCTLTFLSQNVGAEKYSRIGLTLRSGLIIGLIVTAGIAAVVTAFRVPLISLYNTNPDVIRIAGYRLMITAPATFLEVTMNIPVESMRGFGHSIEPLVTCIVTICVFRIIYMLTVFPHFPVYLTIILIWPVSWALSSVAGFLFLKRIRSQFPYEDGNMASAGVQ